MNNNIIMVMLGSLEQLKCFKSLTSRENSVQEEQRQFPSVAGALFLII